MSREQTVLEWFRVLYGQVLLSPSPTANAQGVRPNAVVAPARKYAVLRPMFRPTSLVRAGARGARLYGRRAGAWTSGATSLLERLARRSCTVLRSTARSVPVAFVRGHRHRRVLPPRTTDNGVPWITITTITIITIRCTTTTRYTTITRRRTPKTISCTSTRPVPSQTALVR